MPQPTPASAEASAEARATSGVSMATKSFWAGEGIIGRSGWPGGLVHILVARSAQGACLRPPQLVDLRG